MPACMVIMSVYAGDVGRDIVIKLDDGQDIPVSIDTSNGTAKLRLTAPLDKEGMEGPSSITARVICDRIGTEDPEFTIPINIR